MKVVLPKYEIFEGRLANRSDALDLLSEMLEKCKIEPNPDYSELERALFSVVQVSHGYFLSRLEALKDAIDRGII